jgi:FMN hydrolase / 5-amino-6-(5-phospho-D-ribitylamino)uracil phosphatase
MSISMFRMFLDDDSTRAPVTMRAMNAGAVRAICFDLDNTLWEVEPVLERAERILADWLRARYPRIAPRFSAENMLEARAALLAEEPHQAHDFTYLRRETLLRLALAAGYEPAPARALAHAAFDVWHAARCEVTPFAEVVPALTALRSAHRLATLSNGNADLARIGLSHHFEVNLSASALGVAKPDPRAYTALASSLTLAPAEILFVGDDPHADVAGPRAVGMQTVWVNRGNGVWPGALPAADACVANLGELVTLLKV